MSRFYFINGIGTDDICKFVDYYKEYYYSDGPSPKEIPGINQGNRSSRYVEHKIDTLIEEGIKTTEDVWHILAWKIGRINHKESINTSISLLRNSSKICYNR